MLRYLAHRYKGNDYMSGYNLLDHETHARMKSKLTSLGLEVYESVQTYDLNGEVISTPLYADFDGVGCEADVLELHDNLTKRFGVSPLIYFSGSKGFHVIYPVTVKSKYAHKVCESFFKAFCSSPFLDEKVYTNRRLFRILNSRHYKTGLYKIQVTPEEIISGQYLELAKKQRPEYVIDGSGNYSRLHAEILKHIGIVQRAEAEKKNNNEYSGEIEALEGIIFPPCIKKLIEFEPMDGEWNETLIMLARFFNARYVDKFEAIEFLLQYPHWFDDEKHVRKVFNSTFNSQSFFGCKNSMFLQDRCELLCAFNDEFKELWILNQNKQNANGLKKT